MDLISAPRLFIAGNAERVGKSLITIGLVQELRRRGLSVSCAVHGPQLSQAALLRRLSGRFARVFDSRLLDARQTLSSCYRASIGAELVVIEGRAGLYDGYSLGSGVVGSDAELAARLGADVALVIDARGMAASAAALFRGYMDPQAGLRLRASILNRYPASSEEQNVEARAAYRRDFEALGQPVPYGLMPQFVHQAYLPPAQEDQWDSIPALAHQFLSDLGSLVRDYIDLEKLEQFASESGGLEVEGTLGNSLPRRTRIAYAEDSCFGVLIQENLELCRHFGAELVPFSPLADEALPQGIGAVYFTGANLRDYGAELAKNESLRSALRAFVLQGGVLYSEGSGTAFLCEAYSLPSEEGTVTFQGWGIINSRAKKKGQECDFREVSIRDDCILGRTGQQARGVFPGAWELSESEGLLSCFLVRGGCESDNAYAEGYSPSAQSLCTFGYLHFDSCPEFARGLVDAAEVVARVGTDSAS